MYGGKFVYQWQLADAEPTVAEPIINRVALHAHAIEFRHPAKDQVMKFEAPLPQDMQNLLTELRKYRKI
jgi:23S rRNA pseudouridine1911/1915/1917 synthase